MFPEPFTTPLKVKKSIKYKYSETKTNLLPTETAYQCTNQSKTIAKRRKIDENKVVVAKLVRELKCTKPQLSKCLEATNKI